MNFLLFQNNLNYNLSDGTLSIVVLSIFVIHLVNGAQFLNDICVAGAAVAVISPFTKK